jgi:hypothetical protein
MGVSRVDVGVVLEVTWSCTVVSVVFSRFDVDPFLLGTTVVVPDLLLDSVVFVSESVESLFILKKPIA